MPSSADDIIKQIRKNQENLSRHRFEKWFSGFTDAEGCFHVSIRKQIYIELIFSITLHIDDVNTLKFIQEELKVGNVRTHKNQCSFTVSKHNDIVNILLPIFNRNPLLTTKAQSLDKFIMLSKIIISWGTVRIPEAVIKDVLELKYAMNTEFTVIQNVKYLEVDWLVGFIEGEGSFFSESRQALHFSLGQHKRNIKVL